MHQTPDVGKHISAFMEMGRPSAPPMGGVVDPYASYEMQPSAQSGAMKLNWAKRAGDMP